MIYIQFFQYSYYTITIEFLSPQEIPYLLLHHTKWRNLVPNNIILEHLIYLTKSTTLDLIKYQTLSILTERRRSKIKSIENNLYNYNSIKEIHFPMNQLLATNQSSSSRLLDFTYPINLTKYSTEILTLTSSWWNTSPNVERDDNYT